MDSISSKKADSVRSVVLAIPALPDFVMKKPYSEEHTYSIKILNRSGRQIAVRMDPSRPIRLHPNDKILVGGNEQVDITFHGLKPLEFEDEDGNKKIVNDRISIEWTNTPDGAAKHFNPRWFIPKASDINEKGERIHKRILIIGYEL